MYIVLGEGGMRKFLVPRSVGLIFIHFRAGRGIGHRLFIQRKTEHRWEFVGIFFLEFV